MLPRETGSSFPSTRPAATWGALGATTLVYLSDVDGVRIEGRPAERLTPEETLRRIEDGTIAGGMALKVRVALEASAAGIGEVVIAGKARLRGGFPGTRIVAHPRNPGRADSAGPVRSRKAPSKASGPEGEE